MATIYIDPDFSAGGDGSEATPFDSWADVTWSAGNSYLQKCGTTFVGTVTVGADGTAGSRITLGSYGSGAAPCIDANGGQYGINTGARPYVTVDGFAVTGVNNANGAGVYKNTSGGAGFVVRNCNVYNIRGSGAMGIKFFAAGAIVENNVIDSIGADGIYGQGDNCVVRGNRITNCSEDGTFGDCIQIGDDTISSHGVTVQNNYCDHSNVDTKQAIIVDTTTVPSVSATVIGNQCIGYRNGATNKAIYVNCAGTRVTGNYIINGVRCIDAQSSATVSGNLIVTYGASASHVGVTISDPSVVCYNNTIINALGGSTSLGYGIGHSAAGDTGCSATNNIIRGFKYGLKAHASASFSENYNDFFDCANNSVNTSLQAVSLGAQSITSNPLIDASYRLTAASPCRGAGTYIAGTRDFSGRKLKRVPDIGARQYYPSNGIITPARSAVSVLREGVSSTRRSVRNRPSLG